MAIIRHTISNIILIVAFLVLAAIASLLYSSDSGQREKIINNTWYQKAQSGIGAILYFSTALADLNLKKNIGFGQNVREKITSIDLEEELGDRKASDAKDSNADGQATASEDVLAVAATGPAPDSETATSESADVEAEQSFWQRTKNLFKEEWQRSRENAEEENAASDNQLSNWFDYQKTEQGAEIIFRIENGQEYKLPLPFGFLNR